MTRASLLACLALAPLLVAADKPATAPAAPAPAAAGKPKCTVLGIEAPALPQEHVRRINEILVAEVQKSGRFAVERGGIAATLGDGGGAPCVVAKPCAPGEKPPAGDKSVSGSVGPVGDKLMFRLRLVDDRSGLPDARVSLEVARAEELPDAVKKAVAQILAAPAR